LTAQREARWYGSRGLGLATAFFCTFLAWSASEFWVALLVITVLGAVVGTAAWGSFVTGGAYASQPLVARAALTVTFLAALLVVTGGGRLPLAVLSASGVGSGYGLDRHGRVLLVPWKVGVGPVEPVTVLDGRVPPELQGRAVDRNVLEEIEAPMASM